MRLTKEEQMKVCSAGALVELSLQMSGSDFRAKRMSMRRSVYEVADLAGVEWWEVVAFEHGRMKCDAACIEKLCRALMALTDDVPRRRRAQVYGLQDVTNPYVISQEVVTASERWVFRHQCSRWNAKGLRRLPVHRFEAAVRVILVRPQLYVRIDPRATFEDPADEGH